mmetsp:Transcript_9140/g.27458  ORF Transcript_9140/g.27458 Transcript_9140/m.27458 type:complete len:283 (-) Transcript_9140:1773-2621(-)
MCCSCSNFFTASAAEESVSTSLASSLAFFVFFPRFPSRSDFATFIRSMMALIASVTTESPSWRSLMSLAELVLLSSSNPPLPRRPTTEGGPKRERRDFTERPQLPPPGIGGFFTDGPTLFRLVTRERPKDLAQSSGRRGLLATLFFGVHKDLARERTDLAHSSGRRGLLTTLFFVVFVVARECTDLLAESPGRGLSTFFFVVARERTDLQSSPGLGGSFLVDTRPRERTDLLQSGVVGGSISPGVFERATPQSGLGCCCLFLGVREHTDLQSGLGPGVFFDI